MMCEDDGECASGCCSRMTREGHSQCIAVIDGGLCPRAVSPKIDYDHLKRQNDLSQRANALGELFKDDYRMGQSNDAFKGKDGCSVSGSVDQCDGQPCKSDQDCHSSCCGHFVSFSLRRCLPVTEDGYCPRFLEPSITSPLPSRLPTIESTIKDMYTI